MGNPAEQLGVLGGTFDPIHHGHLIAARVALEALGLDRLLMMPNARSPLRLEEKPAPAAARLEMTRLAVEAEPGLEACDVETARQGTSYLVDSLETLRVQYPSAILYFLLGVDSLSSFERWRAAERIAELARVCVMPRPGADATLELTALERRCPALRGKLILIGEGPHIGISATHIRERVREGRSIRYLVPAAVAEYIQENRLYRSDL